jgi:thiamine-monophosphate kinase
MRLTDSVAENRLLSRWAELLGRAPGQIGGVHEADAELVPLGDGRLLALTVDNVDEEIRAGLYRDPRTAGRAAAVAALSDLAAVGADPLGLLLSVGLPRPDRERVQEGVARGVREVCEAASTFVLGGDTNDADTLTVAGFAAGLVSGGPVLTRLGARPGDVVALTGRVGAGSALAAARLLAPSPAAAGYDEDDWRPLPRLREGRLLRGVASACMDTSDGLVATLDQLARLNGVAIRIGRSAEDLLEPGAAAVRARLGLPAFAFLAGHHGEFELAFTVPAGAWGGLAAAASRAGWTPLAIGQVEAGEGLLLGTRAVDGARVRNLLGDVGGDPVAYARALAEMAAAV